MGEASGSGEKGRKLLLNESIRLTLISFEPSFKPPTKNFSAR
jgi:hypothetical protein